MIESLTSTSPTPREAPEETARRREKWRKSLFQRAIMCQMLGISEEDANGEDPMINQRAMDWTDTYAMPYTTLYENDDAFKALVSSEQLEKAIAYLTAHVKPGSEQIAA